MSSGTANEISAGVPLSGPSEHRACDLESLIRQKMRLHPLVRVIHKFGLLPRVARAFGRYAGLASHSWHQLVARRKP